VPLFRYKAVAANGEVLEGALEAGSQSAAIERLQEMGHIPIQAQEASAATALGPTRSKRLFARRGVGNEQVSILTRELATLLRAGLPLDRAMEVLIGLADEAQLRAMLLRIRDEVRGGAPLSTALSRQSGTFSRLYVSMVRAGEAGGALGNVLLRLSEYMERSNELRATVVSALIYPIILVAVSLLSVMALLIFVVPQFTQMFEEAGKALPLATQIVVAAGNFLRDWWWALLVSAFGGTFLLRRWLENPAARLAWDGRLLRLPLAGDLIAKLEVARFARTLATLLGNGVPLLAALSIVKETLDNTALAAALDRVAAELKEGRGLGKPMLQQGLFPPLAVQMVMVGEETGRLEEMLLQVTEVYDKEVQRAVKRTLSLLEPALILGLAVIIAGIILSILVAILGVNELAR